MNPLEWCESFFLTCEHALNEVGLEPVGRVSYELGMFTSDVHERVVGEKRYWSPEYTNDSYCFICDYVVKHGILNDDSIYYDIVMVVGKYEW